jgi:hypothetical protein
MRLVFPSVAIIAVVGGLVGWANIVSFSVRDVSVLECSLYLVQMIAAPVQLLALRASGDSYMRPPDISIGVAVYALVGMPFHALYPRPIGAAATLLGLVAWLLCILIVASQAT